MIDLTPEEMDGILGIINGAGMQPSAGVARIGRCPSCTSVLQLQKELVAVEFSYGRRAEYAVMACKSCGYVRHHSMHLLGKAYAAANPSASNPSTPNLAASNSSTPSE